MQSIISILALVPLALAGPFTIVSQTSGFVANTTVSTTWSMSDISSDATGFALNLMNGDANAANTVAYLASGISVNATSVSYVLPGTLQNGADYFLQLCESGVGSYSNSICSYSARFPITGGVAASTTTSTASPTDATTPHTSAAFSVQVTTFTIALMAVLMVTL